MSRYVEHESERSLWLPTHAQVEELNHQERIDPLRAFIGSVPILVANARNAEVNAESPRGFYVTSSAYVYDEEENRSGIITTANYKAYIRDDERHDLDVDNIPKVCAEVDVINVAEGLGYSALIGIVVAATSNKKKIFDVTHRPASTLVPCGDCRDIAAKSPIVHDNTFVISVGMKRDIWQFHTVDGLRRAYDKPAEKFKDSPTRIYIPLEWMFKQQDYDNRIEKHKLDNPFTDRSVARSRRHLQEARKAIEF